MISADVFLPGILILLHNYSPQNVQNRIHFFLTFFLAITRHNPMAPEWLRFAGQNNVPSFTNRGNLLTWFYNLAGIQQRWTLADSLRRKPEYWGKFVWSLIHGTGLLVRDETDRMSFVRWVLTLPSLLPCKVCSTSFGHVIRTIPNRHIMANVYGMRLHEAVNYKLKKPALYYPSGEETWQSALQRQNLLNFTPLGEIPAPSQNDSTEHPNHNEHSRPVRPLSIAPPCATSHTQITQSVCKRSQKPECAHKKSPKHAVIRTPKRVHIEHQHVNCNCSRR